MESKSGNPAEQALAEAAVARTAVAARVVAPWWYFPLMGLLAALHVLAQGASNLSWTLPSGVLLFGGSAAAWLLWRREMGVTVWPAAGWRSLLALGAWSLGVMLCAWAAAASREMPVVAAAAVAVLVVTMALGRAWAAVLRYDLARPDGWTA